MSLSSTDKGLLTPGNCAVMFIDHQPQMFFGVANIDRQALLNNVLVLERLIAVLIVSRRFEFESHFARQNSNRSFGLFHVKSRITHWRR